MKVLKFGGTSVGSSNSIKNVKSIIQSIDGQKIIVLSAMSGVTNLLVDIAENIRSGNQTDIVSLEESIKSKHVELIEMLMLQSEIKSEVLQGLEKLFAEFHLLIHGEFSENTANQILIFGETLSSYIFNEYLRSCNIPSVLLNAKKFMFVSNLENPDTAKINQHLRPFLKNTSEDAIYITQGFVRIDKINRVSTLKRGGSDYTATIIGAAIDAEEVQI